MTLSLLMWPSHIATFEWMPWVVLTVERAWREGGRRIFGAALVGGIQMLAGGPEVIMFTWLLLATMQVADVVSRRGRPVCGNRMAENTSESPDNRSNRPAAAKMAALRFALIVALVAMLAAAQLLPFLDLVAHSQRETGFADTRWSIPDRGWANFFVPMAFGLLSNMGVFFQVNQGWTSSYYLGMSALLLALLGTWSVPRRRTVLLTVVAACALLFAFGDQTFVYRKLRELIPQLSLMTYPVKYLLLVTFIVPLLAAFALARLKIGKSAVESVPIESARSLLVIGATLLLLIAGILVWSRQSPSPTDKLPATMVNGLTRAGFLIASVGLLTVMARMGGQGSVRFAPLMLILVAWWDVRTHMPPQNPAVAPWIYEPGLARTKLAMQPQPIFGESRAMITPAAVWSFTQFVSSEPAENFIVKRLGYFADCNILDSVPKVDGFFSLRPRECGELCARLYGSTNAHFPRLLDFLGVSQITAPDKLFEWEARTSFLPLITAGQMPVFLDDTNAVRSLIRPEFDGSRFVFLSPEVKSLATVTNATTARVKGWRLAVHRVDLEVEAESPSLVILAQTYYHCWRAYVDDSPVPLLRANYAFQAVEVPAGSHQIRLAYEDRPFQIGALISGISWLGSVTGCSWRKRA